MQRVGKAVVRDELKEKIRSYLEENRKELRELHNREVLSGRQLVERRSRGVDGLISQVLTGLGFSKLSGVSIVALGGDGRDELCPYSDVDLLFLFAPRSKSLAKDIVQELLYLLWDLNFEIGHSVRTIDDCIEVSRGDDATIFTSLLDGRFIFGDKKLFDQLDRIMYRELLPEISSKFIEGKIAENEKRIERFGRSVYLIEPHVKEGEGGLRDIHSALWIAKAKFKVRSFRELIEKGVLLERELRVFERCVSKPKVSFHTPKTVFLDNSFIIQGGMLSVSKRTVFQDHPENLMRAFEVADKYGIKMSKYLHDLIRDNVKIIDDHVRRNPELNASFIWLLKEGKEVANALFDMNRLRLLGHFIPEFGKIVCMVQHDAYHVYTVDIHSIFMVNEIENLKKGEYEKQFPLVTQIAKEVSKRHILYLACLFHDMGKGEGRDHSQRGAGMIPRISERMGLTEEESDQLEFIVKHHLVMPHFSQRRDIHDDGLILRFARSVKTLETLSMLYLFSFADIRSVGPDVWANWEGMVLEQLYKGTANVLARGEFKRETPKRKSRRFIREVIQLLKNEIPESNIRRHLDVMPYTYFLGFSPEKIVYHVKLFEGFGDDTGCDVIYNENEGYDEFTFWGYDNPGGVSHLCGVLAGSSINILGARIITRDDGRIVDVFYVNRLGKSTSEDNEIWNKVSSNLYGVLKGEIDVEQLVSRRKRQKPIYIKPIPQHPTRIDIDNESSDTATVMDIYTNDRVGLLYDITKTLTKLGLSVDYAKISTKVDQWGDVFYVREIVGGKVFDEKKLEK